MNLHDTLTSRTQDLVPISRGIVKLYTCGLTVYSQPHIGNWVAYIYWDVLVRVLQAEGHTVERVQNITDVGHLTDDSDAGEDKMIKSALREGKTAWDVAEKYIQVANHEAYELLGLLKPDRMPRATEYISQQIAFIQELESKGYTYAIDDGVYFDTSKLADYGRLAKLDISGLQFGVRVADAGKKSPTDFALWKLSSPNAKRDMEWPSPWGVGFPGWHLECSIMARELLGDQIDIHTGGIDHIPVHHTNEIAQTEALTEKPFSKLWVHCNHLKIDGTKISKSLGNIITLQDIIDRGYDIQAFKLQILSKHYRTEGNFTWEILDAAAGRLKHWYDVATLRHQIVNTSSSAGTNTSDTTTRLLTEASQKLKDCLAHDLNTPGAVAVIDAVFAHLDSTPPSLILDSRLVEFLATIRDLLGIDLSANTIDIPDKLKQLIRERQCARDEKNWQRSDELRDELLGSGVALRDTPHGVIWSHT